MTEPARDAAHAISTVVARVVTITPQLARGLIEHRNNSNRDVTLGRVDQYAEDIRRGEWIVNGEAIKISRDGEVLDGQHRLLAVLDADAPITTVLITGLPPEAQESMDQGRPRTFGDVLKLRGEKDYYVLAAAVRIVTTYERSGIPLPGYVFSPSNQQLSASLKRNPEIRDSCAFANRHRQRWINVSVVGALHYLFSAADAARAGEFFRQLTVASNTDQPIRQLRERLVAEHEAVEHPRLHVRTKIAYVVKTWNAWLDSAALELSWRSDEPFPTISGLADDEEREAA